nr:MAG TPA: PcfJ like protein [Caudoviricetes sp.]
MKKKELLKHIPENAEEPFIKRIRTSDGMALMTVLPDSDRVHFTWKDGYLTYDTETCTWSRTRITSACQIEKNWPRDEKSRKEAESFCKGAGSAINQIDSYEYRISWKKSCNAQERKFQRIQKMMEDVPALPPRFVDWIKKRYQSAEDKYTRVHFTSLFQKMPDGRIVERIFRVVFFKNPEKMFVTEVVRGYESEIGAKEWSDWYYGTIRNFYGTKQRWWDKKCIMTYTPLETDIYPKNLEDLGIGIQGREIIKGIPGKICRWKLMDAVKRTPDLAERAVKAGLGKCLTEFINAEGAAGVAKMADALERVGRQKAKRLIAMNASSMMLITLDLCPKATDETLKKIGKIKREITLDQIAEILGKGINANHFWKLMETTEKEMSCQEKITMYRDYLDMAERRGCDIRSEIIYRNKRWRYFHDLYLAELNRKKDEERAAKFPGICRDLERNRKIFGWQQDDYFVRPAESAEDIIHEGRMQHHCVGASDTYMVKMATRKSWICFLRKKEAPEEPWYTIETDGEKILQAYAAYDRKPDWKETDEVLQDWIRQVRKNMAAMVKEENQEEKTEKKLLMAAG